MLIVKKVPWTSSALLLATYSTFGWFLYPPNYSGFNWVFAAVFAIVIAGLLTAPQRSLRSQILSWSVSNIGTFIIVVSLAFLTAVVLYLAHVFIHIFLSIAASILLRLDIQTIGIGPWPAFGILSVLSLLGLSLGWLLNHYFL